MSSLKQEMIYARILAFGSNVFFTAKTTAFVRFGLHLKWCHFQRGKANTDASQYCALNKITETENGLNGL